MNCPKCGRFMVKLANILNPLAQNRLVNKKYQRINKALWVYICFHCFKNKGLNVEIYQ